MRQPSKESSLSVLIPPVSISASTNSTNGVDTSGWMWVRFILSVGVITQGGVFLALQDSADNTTFAAVSDALFSATISVTPTAGAQPSEIAVFIPTCGYRRYMRCTARVVGTTTAVVSVMALLSEPVTSDKATQVPSASKIA